MKKILALFCVLTLICSLSGCERNTKPLISTESHTDFPGVTLEIISIDDSGEDPILNVRWHNRTEYHVVYGAWYTIERKNGDEWLNTAVADVNFAMTGYTILPYTSADYREAEMTYTTKYFDLSQEGTYRLRTNCTILEPQDPDKSSSSSESCVLWVEFDVVDANARQNHKITMNDADWLYEKLPTSAKVGDKISVKISKAYDVGYIFLMNGEQIGMTDDTDEYWIFAFTMPDEDVEIDFKTYDGFLPDMNYGVLIETFWKQNPDAEYVNIREYYGEYESGAIVAMIDSGDYTSNVWSEEVAGCEFIYGDGNCLQVLYDGNFYKLPEGYEKGCLTEADIHIIYEQYVEAHAGAYAENER